MAEDFASWLKGHLHQRRMTAGELAGKARISRAAAYFYVGGDRVPGAATLTKIAAALGIPAQDLPEFNLKSIRQSRASVSASRAA